MTSKTLYQGAEAIITLKRVGGRGVAEGKEFIEKHRIKKSYRLPELDNKIRKSRTKKEAKLLEKALTIINVPKILKVDNEKNTIILEYIKGKKLSQALDTLKNKNKICEQIGKEISKLHSKDIIHGDLTTSNMILNNNNIFFVDFGLGFVSKRIEDKAVDIHLLKQALEAKHYKHFESLTKSVIKGYLSIKDNKEAKEVIERLKKVESRGRYKH